MVFKCDSFSQTNILIHFDSISVQLILTSYTTYEENIPYPRKSGTKTSGTSTKVFIGLRILLTSTCVVRQAQKVNLITRVSISLYFSLFGIVMIHCVGSFIDAM